MDYILPILVWFRVNIAIFMGFGGTQDILPLWNSRDLPPIRTTIIHLGAPRKIAVSIAKVYYQYMTKTYDRLTYILISKYKYFSNLINHQIWTSTYDASPLLVSEELDRITPQILNGLLVSSLRSQATPSPVLK